MKWKTTLLVGVAITGGLIVTVMIGDEDRMMRKVVWGEDGVMLQSNDGEVGEEELGENNDDYVVLLDTGNYYNELKKKDTNRATFTPTTTHTAKVQTRYSEPQIHGTQSTAAIVMDIIKERISAPQHVHLSNGKDSNTTVRELQQAGTSRDVIDTAAIDLLSQTSKEESYARQATSTYPPPLPQWHLHKITAPNTVHGQKHTSSQCTEPPCLKYLSLAEKKKFEECQRVTVTHKSTHTAPKCQCRFRERNGKKRVALNSLPGSGNTWLRGLLEKATGLCTGYQHLIIVLSQGTIVPCI